MMFLRYESFREYVRYYPVNTALLALVILVHVGFAIASAVYNVPVQSLKMVYGGFVRFPSEGIFPEFWRYISSVFMHNDFGHLLFNGFAIFVFAPPLERVLGGFRYGVLFLFSGIMGNIFTNFYSEPVASLGASGAVYGIFGAYLYYMAFHRRAMDANSKKTLQILLVVGVIYSIVIPQINLLAHLGGLFGGFVLNLLYTRVLLGQGQGRYR